MARPPQKTNWCFTLNETDTVSPIDFALNLEALYEEIEPISYICGQVERGESGTLHFQGYLQTKKKVRFTVVKRYLKQKQVHLEYQKARDSSKARDYTRKDDTSAGEWQEFGTFKPSAQGKRNDIIKFKDSVKTGMSMRQMLELFPDMIAKYPRLYSTVRSLYRPERAEDYVHQVTLCYGAPGTGKTRWAREQEDLYVQPLSNGTAWFDGFDQHKCALLDDFAGKMSKISLTNTLQLLDRYPIAVPIKGGHVWWMPEHLIITTNIHPRGWYKWDNREVHWLALKRRITQILVFHEEGDIEVLITPDELSGFLDDIDLWPLEQSTDENYGSDGKSHN